MTKLLLLLLFFLPIKATANYIDYYNTTNEAEWLYDNKKYDEAESIFIQAFKTVDSLAPY